VLAISPGGKGEDKSGGEEKKLGLAHGRIVAQNARRGKGTAAGMAAGKRHDAIAARMAATLAAAR